MTGPPGQGGCVVLLGARLDVGNMGCRALAVSLVTLLTRQSPGVPLVLFYGNPEARPQEVPIEAGRTVSVGMINYRMSPRACHREHLLWLLLMALLHRAVPIERFRTALLRHHSRLALIRSAAVVADIHGGDSFSDIYGIRRFFFNVAPSAVALLLERPLVLLPQTYGPYKSRLARWVARGLMRRAAVVMSRDQKGLRVVGELTGGRVPVMCPDVAFCLEPIPPANLRVEPPLNLGREKPVVALNVSGLLHMGGYTRDNMFGLKGEYPRFVELLIERMVRDTDAEILLLPHVLGQGVESDVRACEQVFADLAPRMEGRLHLLQGDYGPNELKWVVGQCDFLVGSRMHACIAAISQGVPCVGVAYSRKFAGVFESVGAADAVLDARTLNVETMVDACLEHWRRRGEGRDKINERLRTVRATVVSTFQQHVLPRNHSADMR